MDKRRSCANCSSTDHHVSACPTYKQGMKAIGFSLEDEDASELDHEDFMRGVIAKFGPKCVFCNLEGHFKSDCPQFWDAVADIKHPRHEEALSGVEASKARLLSEVEARRKDKPQELATKKMQAVTEETREPEPVTAADDFKIDYRAAARDALNRVQQELVTNEIEQKVKLELENEKLQEQLNAFEATEVEETKVPSSLSMKLNVISGQRFGMVPQGSKIQSIISVAGHQVIRNLSEPSELTLMHLDTYADYLRHVEPRTESRAVRALLITDMNPITIVFAGINDHLHSRGFLSRLRDPLTAENAVWPAIKNILESMGEVVDATKEGSFTKVTPRIVFALSPGYAHLPDGLKFVYAIVTLLSERKYDVIISAPNCMIEMENLQCGQISQTR